MIIIDGPMGSGKTTIATLLNKKLKRTAHVGIDRIKFFVSDFKRDHDDNQMTLSVLLKMIDEYIKNGINILIAQGLYKKEHLDPYVKIAKKKNLRLFMYQLDAPNDVLLERIIKRPKPAEARTKVSKINIMNNLKGWSENRQKFEKVFDTSKISEEKIVKEILKDIKKL
jgi:predicted kinase